MTDELAELENKVDAIKCRNLALTEIMNSMYAADTRMCVDRIIDPPLVPEPRSVRGSIVPFWEEARTRSPFVGSARHRRRVAGWPLSAVKGECWWTNLTIIS